MTRVRTLPMSCSNAAQRTIGLGTDCSTTCLVCSQTSLCRRPASCEKSTVASSSGSTTASTPASCIHCSPAPSDLPMITVSIAWRSCAAGSATSSGAAARAASVTSGRAAATAAGNAGGQVQHSRRLGAERRGRFRATSETLAERPAATT